MSNIQRGAPTTQCVSNKLILNSGRIQSLVSMVGNEFDTGKIAPMSSSSWIITVESAFFPLHAEERRIWDVERGGLNQKNEEKNGENEAVRTSEGHEGEREFKRRRDSTITISIFFVSRKY